MKEKDPRFIPRIVQHTIWEVECRGCLKLLRFQGPLAALYKGLKDHCPAATAWRKAQRAAKVPVDG